MFIYSKIVFTVTLSFLLAQLRISAGEIPAGILLVIIFLLVNCLIPGSRFFHCISAMRGKVKFASLLLTKVLQKFFVTVCTWLSQKNISFFQVLIISIRAELQLGRHYLAAIIKLDSLKQKFNIPYCVKSMIENILINKPIKIKEAL